MATAIGTGVTAAAEPALALHEARHQVERVGGRTEQTLGLMFSFNLAPLIWLPIAGNLR